MTLAGLDLDALGCGVQQDALGDLDLLGGDGGSRLQIGYDDAPILTGDVLAVIGSNHRTCRVCNQESHALQRLIAGFCFQILLNGQSRFGVILEGEIIPIAAPTVAAGTGNTCLLYTTDAADDANWV